MSKSIIIVFCLLLVGSCKKNPEPSNFVNEPVYFLAGEINGQAKEIKAGVDKMYLFTDYVEDSLNGAWIFKGRFKKNCTNCLEELAFELTDYKTIGQMIPDSSFKTGSHPFSYANEPLVNNYVLQLTANPKGSGNVINQNWELNGLNNVDSSIVVRNFSPGKDVVVKYSVSYANCQSSLEYKIKFAPQMKPSDLPVIHTQVLDSAKLMYKIWATGMGNSQYFWDMGDGTQLSGSSIFYGFTSQGVYSIKLLQINRGDTNEVKQQIQVGGSSSCIANFEAAINPELDPYNFRTIKLIYTNPAGEKFYSKEVKQTFHSSFDITHQRSSAIEIPSNRIRDVEIEFSAILKGTSGELKFKNWRGKIALGHP